MKVGVIGAGRLGICFALLLEKAGYDVLVSDIREEYVDRLNQKVITTNEPQVHELLLESNKLEATTDNKRVIKECDIIYTLVATPSLSDGSYDVSAVWQVVDDFQSAGVPVHGKSFVVGCTTNPGDCENFQSQLDALGVDVFYNPEFIAQGSIINDLQYADMVLIGGPNTDAYRSICEMYYAIQVVEPKINLMSTKAAEIVKLAINCYLTTKISYANMIGEVLTLSGLESEIETVLTAIGKDSRIGSKYLKYGFGFGGPCLPRDNKSLGAFANNLGLKYNLGLTVDGFNQEHGQFLKKYFIEKNPDKDTPFYFEYVSYKKGTDILTESQRLQLCVDLLSEGYSVYINDIESVISQIRDILQRDFPDKVYFLSDHDLPSVFCKIEL